jgi:hypothetical protein
MHYSASFQLPYLRVSYSAVTVVFALILAATAATAALFAFFKFRAQWSDSFWKRGLCAIFLAVAVCGMHYLGLGGSSYQVRQGVVPSALQAGQEQSRRLTIAISVMCAVIIVIAVALAFSDLLTRRDMRDKARHIVIASATFADDGRILVKHDGTIPMQAIETEADLKRVMGELDPRQTTFQWLYQLSYNWQLVRPFVPRIADHFTRRRSKPANKTSASTWQSEKFRQRFVEASVLLAQQLGMSVESLGELFDRVMTTGTRLPSDDGEEVNHRDDESSIHGITLKLHNSEGVLLFLVRELGNGHPMSLDYPKMNQDAHPNFDTVDYWLERGYRLTETRFFSRTLADHMGVAKGEMDVFLSACKTYAKRGARPVVQTGGTYLGMFGVRPTTAGHGIDVLVYNFARHQIPAYRLPDVQFPLTASMRAWIRECSNMTMGEVSRRAHEAIHRAETSDTGSGSIQSQDDEALYEFQGAMAVAIESLSTALKPWPQIQNIARLSPEILELPSTNFDDEPPAQMVVLEVVLPAPEAHLSPVQSRASGIQAPVLHSGRAESDKPPPPFIYTPWTLFAKSQNMLIRGKMWNEVCKSLHAEIAKSYPLVPTDLAAEIAAEEKGIPDMQSPFADASAIGRWTARRKNMTIDTTHGRHASLAQSITSPGAMSDNTDDFDYEKVYNSKFAVDPRHVTPPAGTGKRPNTGGSEGGIKKQLNAIVGRTGGHESHAQSATRANAQVHGPPIYQQIRTKLDGWYLRSMRTLERSEFGSWFDGYDWQTSAREI